MKRRISLGLLPVLVFAACSGDTQSPTAVDTDLVAGFDHVGDGYVEHFTVCKTYVGAVGPAVTVDWVAVRENGGGSSGSVMLADGECAVVYEYINDAQAPQGLEEQTVTVTERAVFGYTTSYVRTSRASIGAPIVTDPEVAGSSASGVMLSNPDNGFQVDFINTEIPSVDGRMTGGGSAFTTDNVRITHGFQVRCDASDSRQNLQVNWEGNRFHMTELTGARCTDNPAFDEGQPKAGFDTFDGVGVGRYNGVDGFDIRFQFVDDGEPGITDIARIQITDPSNGDAVVMTVGNVLDRGNHQAHR